MAKKAVKEKKEEKGESFSARLGEFGSAVLQIAEEKGIEREKVIEVVEAALAAAYKKDYGKKGQVIRAEFDEVTKDAKFFLVKEVVDETTREFVEETEEGAEPSESVPAPVEEGMSEEDRLPRYNPERDLTLDEAKAIKKGAKVGDIIETELPAESEFGRVAAQTAKQVIIQRIREAERESMFKEYKSREGEIVNGSVQRVEGRVVFVDLGKSVGVLFPSEQVEGETYRIGQRLKVYIQKVESDPKGPGITLSRATAEMVRHLFTLEVPEIANGTVVIKAIAREAGSRTKLAVHSDEEGVDPIGSCVGQKGTRVQAVIEELHGEKIDIIQWNDDADKFIRAALSPAKVLSVTLDEETKTAAVVVPEDQLSLAIGRRGQNVRLAAKLSGWKIDVSGTGVPTQSEAGEGESAETPAEFAETVAETSAEAAETPVEEGEAAAETPSENIEEGEAKA